MLHYKACARTRRQKAADIALMIFGIVAAVYTTAQTIKVRLRLPHRALLPSHCMSLLSIATEHIFLRLIASV